MPQVTPNATYGGESSGFAQFDLFSSSPRVPRPSFDDGTPRGAVFIPFCYYEAAANVLTNPVLDPFGKIPEFKYYAVKVRPGGARPGDPATARGARWRRLPARLRPERC